MLVVMIVVWSSETMNTKNHTPSHPAEGSEFAPLRSPADITAYTIHALGYWPENSIVVLGISAGGVGPCMRADLIDLEEPEHMQSYISHLMEMMPEFDAAGHRFDTFFTLYFGKTSTAEARKIQAGESWQPHLQLIQKDAESVARIQPWAESSFAAARAHNIHLVESFYISTYTRWRLDDAHELMFFDGMVDEIVMSPHYAQMIAHGSSVAHASQDSLPTPAWDVLATSRPDDKEQWLSDSNFWFTSYRATITAPHSSYAQNYHQQKSAEFKLWEHHIQCIIDSCAKSETSSAPSTAWADLLRDNLAPEISGFLASTITTMGTGQLILALACTSLKTAVGALTELDELEDATEQAPQKQVLFPVVTRKILDSPPSHPEPPLPEHSLDNIAGYLMGTSRTAPHWERLEALEVLLNMLSHIAEGGCLARIYIMQAWIHWLKGRTSAACAVLEHSKQYREETEFIAFEEAINQNFIPLWCQDSRQTWRGTHLQIPNFYPPRKS